MECQGLTGFAHAIEPSRRTRSDHFPVGIVWSPDLESPSDEDIQEIARGWEVRKRMNNSWIGDRVIGGDELQIHAVDHPPRGAEVATRIQGFFYRLRSTLASALQIDLPWPRMGPRSSLASTGRRRR